MRERANILKGKIGRKQVINIALTVVSLIAFVLIWWALSLYLEGQNLDYLPPPNVVLDAFVQSLDFDPVTGLPLSTHILASLNRFFWGFVIAIGIAIPLGLLMGFISYAKALGMPAAELIRPIPPIALAPLFFAAFGVLGGAIATVFIGIFFPVLYNVIFGVSSVDPILLDAARTQGASKFQLFSKVILPFTVPYLMTGVSIGVGIGWMVIVAAEWIAAPGGGVGSLIFATYQSGRWPYMFVGLVAIAILGLLTTSLSRVLENRVSRWMGFQ